jgi:thiol-disulfide isomerase/thioredoxin
MSSLAFGIFTIKTSQLLLIICLLAALAIAVAISWRRKEKVTDSSLQIILLSFGIARLVFVATWFEQYWKAPLSILDIRDGGFNMTAGIIAGCALVAWRIWRQPTLRTPLAAGTLTFLLAWGFATPSAESFAGEVALPASPVTTFDGKTTTFGELAHGKPLVVNLWASWCPPCRREMPLLVEAQKKNKDIAFVFVNEDNDPDEALFFANQMKVPAGSIVGDSSNALMQAFRTRVLPTTLYYSADGQLVSTHVGGLSAATLESALKTLKK